MLYNFCFYFLVFIIYSFLGWVMEVFGKFIEKHRFINRGFLIGPVCSIYGFGCIFMYFLLDKYKNNLFILFIAAIFVCSILEYFTSYFMEKIFKTRWWDYTRRKFNINGRICLETMIPFGILGCLVIRVVNPIVFKLLNLLTDNSLIILAIIIFIIYIVDNIVSSVIIFNFRDTIKNIEKDATEEITMKVKSIFLHKGILSRRLVKAFPTMITNKDRLLLLRDKVNNELKKIEENSKIKLDTAREKGLNKIEDLKKGVLK